MTILYWPFHFMEGVVLGSSVKVEAKQWGKWLKKDRKRDKNERTYTLEYMVESYHKRSSFLKKLENAGFTVDDCISLEGAATLEGAVKELKKAFDEGTGYWEQSDDDE